VYSARYDAALVLAARLHRNQLRKGTDIPYLTHVVHVSVILLRYGFDEDLAIAGLLHDTVEDQRYPLERIAEQFGARVGELVAANSEHSYEDGVKRPWDVRKQEKMAVLRTTSLDALAVKAADLLHNVQATTADFHTSGPALWKRFTRGRDGLLWYYRTVADILSERLVEGPGHALAQEVARAVGELERLAVES
jgi:(p)ppGpp synthase/HD superfamily hydrolase